MAQDVTLHVKLDSGMDAKLKQLAKARRKSKGQLVREAVSTCYQIERLEHAVWSTASSSPAQLASSKPAA